jgi:hypothetical protein
MTSDLDAEDVKNKLFHSLKSRGVLDSLKVCVLLRNAYDLRASQGAKFESNY